MRLRSLVAVLAVFVSTVRCGNGADDRTTSDKYRIGITQIASHPGIDAVRGGFLDEMTRLGLSTDSVVYVFLNANGDNAAAQAIASQLLRDSLDLIFSISTPSTQALVNAVKNSGAQTPIVFGAITDPVSAGVVSSLEAPGERITGTSDAWPIAQQYGLMTQLLPTARRVGILHNPAESNASYSVRVAIAEATRRGLKVVQVPVSSTNDVVPATRSLVGEVDVIYIPADNTVISALGGLIATAERYKIPVVPGDASNVEVGGIGTIGNDYRSVGAQSANIAARILRGTPPREIPVALPTQYGYYFNLRSAAAVGVVIPDSLVQRATAVYRP